MNLRISATTRLISTSKPGSMLSDSDLALSWVLRSGEKLKVIMDLYNIEPFYTVDRVSQLIRGWGGNAVQFLDTKGVKSLRVTNSHNLRRII